MANNKLTQRQMAFEMYCKGFTQQRIAEFLKLDPNTISEWKYKYDWDKKFSEVNQPAVEAERMIWKIMLHNLSIINAEIDGQNESTEKTLISTGSIDALVKLLSKVKLDKVTPADIAKIIEDFIKYLARHNPEGAKLVYEDAMSYVRSCADIN